MIKKLSYKIHSSFILAKICQDLLSLRNFYFNYFEKMKIRRLKIYINFHNLNQFVDSLHTKDLHHKKVNKI